MNIPLTPIRFLRYAQQQFPKRTAVVCGDQRFTYSQFADRVSRLAGALRQLGIENGERVAVLSANCHRFLEAYFAVPEADGVLLPLNTRLAPPELSFILNDAKPAILFFEEAFSRAVEAIRDEIPSVRRFILLDELSSQSKLPWAKNYEGLLPAAMPFRRDIMDVNENSVAEIFYTSGTTSSPKGVMLSHRNVYLHAINHSMTFDATRLTTHLHVIPLFHVNGWGAVHYIGAKHVMIRRFSPTEVFQLIEREAVSSIALVPAMATALLESPECTKHNLKSLERIRIGGSAPSPTLVREIQEKLGGVCFSAYGLTEASPSLTSSMIKPGLGLDPERSLEIQALSGYAIPGAEVRVVDTAGNDVPCDGNSVGEVIARSDGVMTGYWGQPEATDDALNSGWLCTGDLATINEDGYLLIVDRKKDIIISGGENISSLELEKLIVTHPAVSEVAVVAVPDSKWGEAPKAFVVLKPGASIDENELVQFCRSRTAHYKAPRVVEFVENLPKTGTGKVLKRKLRDNVLM
jgi:fatty-acyl-CoA synthase